MKKIAIFASGSGSNAENIAKFSEKEKSFEVKLILTNNPNAFVIERAKKLGIKAIIFNREEFYNTEKIRNILTEENIDCIVLAGFLWLVPAYLIEQFPNKIINIHPALLPKFGGKGMYGDNVHKAVISSGESKSGITIHLVNNKYDEGKILFQAECTIEPSDTHESLAQKIHKLEYEYFPSEIARYVNKK